MNRFRLVSVASATMMTAVWLTIAAAAPPRPPGGPHPLHRGGDNRAGYPPISSVAVDPPPAAPVGRLIVRAHPNPSRGATRFWIHMPRADRLRVRLYSVAGRLVREWTGNVGAEGGTEWSWDGRDHRGAPVPTGLYFFRAETAGQRFAGRLVLLR